MSQNRLFATTVLLLFTLVAPLLLGAAPSAPSAGDTQNVKKAVSDLRSVGTATWAWYKAEVEPRRSAEAKKAAEKLAKEGKPVDLANIPVISTADLRKILVPKYIQTVPEQDPWGNPYEYRLNTTDPNAPQLIAVRTAGQDGEFSSTSYDIGGFPVSRTGEDIAWMDGYFIRWPAAN
ncbi:MAG TPA: hypothetical protein VHU81_02955 [Thermoanaerobaculia bacterium]|nr:hypothetical protein [Thermoanaerobaculia bacterium]